MDNALKAHLMKNVTYANPVHWIEI